MVAVDSFTKYARFIPSHWRCTLEQVWWVDKKKKSTAKHGTGQNNFGLGRPETRAVLGSRMPNHGDVVSHYLFIALVMAKAFLHQIYRLHLSSIFTNAF